MRKNKSVNKSYLKREKKEVYPSPSLGCFLAYITINAVLVCGEWGGKDGQRGYCVFVLSQSAGIANGCSLAGWLVCVSVCVSASLKWEERLTPSCLSLASYRPFLFPLSFSPLSLSLLSLSPHLSPPLSLSLSLLPPPSCGCRYI